MALAQRTLLESADRVATRLQRIFRRVLMREPSAREAAHLARVLERAEQALPQRTGSSQGTAQRHSRPPHRRSDSTGANSPRGSTSRRSSSTSTRRSVRADGVLATGDLLRRALFGSSAVGLGDGALAWLLERDGAALRDARVEAHLAAAPRSSGSLNEATARRPHFSPRAKSVIYIHLVGAPSHLDLFDPKPELQKRDGQKCPDEFFKGKRLAFISGVIRGSSAHRRPSASRSAVAASRACRSGNLLPHLQGCADKLCMIRTLPERGVQPRTRAALFCKPALLASAGQASAPGPATDSEPSTRTCPPSSRS